MPAKCLLCGYTGEDSTPGEGFHSCSWCRSEALQLDPQEVAALVKLEDIRPRFRVWDRGRREDSGAKCQRLTEPQPARLLPGLPLYVGDIDDAADVERLRELGIGCVVNLCAERVVPGCRYELVPSRLAEARINQLVLLADDSRSCDILRVAEQAFAAIGAALAGPDGRSGVLVHCWGGVNRSAAVAVAFLASQRGVPLLAAVDAAMSRRGTVLTNQSFRRQLVRYCFSKGLPFEGAVPAALLEAPAAHPTEPEDVDALLAACTDGGGCGHRPAGPNDTPVYGLLFAARDGCLVCVRDYIEKQGVDAGSRSNIRKYTAKDWATWELDRARSGSATARKRRLEAVLSYLARRAGEPAAAAPAGGALSGGTP